MPRRPSTAPHELGTSQIAQTTLRSVLGRAELDTLLSGREQLNENLQTLREIVQRDSTIVFPLPPGPAAQAAELVPSDGNGAAPSTTDTDPIPPAIATNGIGLQSGDPVVS